MRESLTRRPGMRAGLAAATLASLALGAGACGGKTSQISTIQKIAVESAPNYQPDGSEAMQHFGIQGSLVKAGDKGYNRPFTSHVMVACDEPPIVSPAAKPVLEISVSGISVLGNYVQYEGREHEIVKIDPGKTCKDYFPSASAEARAVKYVEDNLPHFDGNSNFFNTFELDNPALQTKTLLDQVRGDVCPPDITCVPTQK